METSIIYAIISTMFNLLAGGGWFINFRLKRKAEQANSEIVRLQAKEDAMEYYLKRIENLETRLKEAEAMVDQLKDTIDELEETIDKLKKYIKKIESN